MRTQTTRNPKQVRVVPYLIEYTPTAKPDKSQPNSTRKLLRYALYKDHFHLLPRFAETMRNMGYAVDQPRMQFDRIYGLERLRQAHSCGNDALREIAVILMTMYAKS